MKKVKLEYLLIILAIFFLPLTLYSQLDHVKDRLSGKKVKITYLAKPEEAFQIVLTDDSADGIESKGIIRFITTENIEWEFPFHFENGKSGQWGVSPSDKVERVIIELKEGSILIDHGGKLKRG